jgi:hypothetical protein
MFVSSSLSNNTYGLPVLTKNTKCPSLTFYVRFVDLHISWAKFVLETWFSPNDDIRKCLLDRSLVELKTRFKTWITINCVCLFHLPYLIKLM